MKKIGYTLLAVLIMITVTLTASAQSEQSRQVSGFSKIASGGPFDVHVNINGTESLKISAKSDVINKIETIVEDGTLKINFKDHKGWDDHDDYGQIDIYVTAKSLSALTNSGSGSLKVEGTVTGSEVKVMLSGSGDIETSVKSSSLHVIISGSGSINLKGSANDAKMMISGSGEIKSRDLKTNDASVNITGSGSAYFRADKTVAAHIVGSGSVVYSGNATVTESATVGSGSVTKAD